jgi:hypothetical protein
MSTQKAEVVTITPAMAEKWLDNNPKNRTLNKRRVARLVKSIKDGQWAVNGEAITIASNGTLVNGQHRLAAVMVSKRPIQSWVIKGVPPEAMATIDLGAVRSLGNHLQMAGIKGAVYALASAVIVCREFRTGAYVHSKEKTSPQEMLEFIEENKRILKAAEIYTAADKAEFRALLPQSLSIASYFMFSKVDRDKAETFFHKLVQGSSLGEKSPILKLRTALIGLRKQSKRAEDTRTESLHYLCTSFQAYLDEKRVDSLPEWKPTTKIMLPRK